MRSKRSLDNAIDYSEFENPYAGLAVMIFVQAATDLMWLGERESRNYHDGVLFRSEVVTFFRSRWARMIAEGVGLDIKDLHDYARRLA